MTRNAGASSGFSAVAGSSVIAGILGYAITILAARLLGVDYGLFGIFWSALYFAVGALSGAQHEFARMTRDAEALPHGHSLRSAVAWAVPASISLATICAVVAAQSVLEAGGLAQAAALGFGLACFGVMAVLLGVQYGARRWKAVAVVTVLDPLLRLTMIVVVIAAGGGLTGAVWAAVVPFPLVTILLLVMLTKSSELRIDSPPGIALLRVGAVVLAGVASSFILNGIPVLFQLVAAGSEPEVLARYVFAFILVRAPLVVGALALQSFLVVALRDHQRPVRLVAVLALLLGVAVAVGSLLIVVTGPELIELLAPDAGSPDRTVLVGIFVASGTTAMLVITGSLALAKQQTALYALGWWVTAGVVVLLAVVLPGDTESRVTLASLVGPIAGILLHFAGLIRPRP